MSCSTAARSLSCRITVALHRIPLTLSCSTLLTIRKEKYEANRRALKNELNVLVPLGELRFVRDVEDANSSSGNGGKR